MIMVSSSEILHQRDPYRAPSRISRQMFSAKRRSEPLQTGRPTMPRGVEGVSSSAQRRLSNTGNVTLTRGEGGRDGGSWSEKKSSHIIILSPGPRSTHG
ncbi:hypothetical protein VDGL01_02468 [Verticillium dahliae]